MEQLKLDLGPGADPYCTAQFRNGRATAVQFASIYNRADAIWRLECGRGPTRDVMPGLNGTSPESAALAVRRTLGRATSPITSVLEAVRRLGVIVGSMPLDAGHVSAYSCWIGDQALMLVQASDAGRRRARFDAAHELGHLILHKGKQRTRAHESEADRFAGVLLLPPEAFDDVRLKPLAWKGLERVADTFGTSRLATLRRAHELGLVSQPVYRAAIIWARTSGWSAADPSNIEPTELAIWERSLM